MPCYCDVPDEIDQAEIQKRCKERMYFNAIPILRADNLKKAQEMGIEICSLPLPDPNTALCTICKILTPQQMDSISADYYQIKWKYKNLGEWYRQHCIDDKASNEVV